MIALADPVTAAPGVGQRMAARLRSAFGTETVSDLLAHYPRRYDDVGEVLELELARVGEPVTLVGTVLGWSQRRPRSRRGGRRLTISEASVRDRGGTSFSVAFFNQQWRAKRLPAGTVAAFSGKLERFRGSLQISMPDVQVLGRAVDGADGAAERLESDHRRLLAVYPATEALPSWRVAALIEGALGEVGHIDDFLPDDVRAEHDLMPLDAAVRAIHLPDDRAQAQRARRRLTFDELYTLQAGLQWRRARFEARVVGQDNGPVDGGQAARFLASLPFQPTGAQRRSFEELARDLAADRPMHRLLQGDVGSGKTLVAVWAMLCAADHDRQAALLVPTGVLAEQHLRTLTELLAPLGVNVLDGVRVELLTGSTPAGQRRRILGELLSGRVDIVVGTHALLEEGVRFDDLGLVVIDEQHRFGVAQRVALKAKGETPGSAGPASAPDVLVMTATPIPRSLALTAYGDLDVTVLDELPPGRQEIVTQLITPEETSRRSRLYEFVREQAGRGLRTYVVCPLVEESEDVAARAAETEHERLSEEVLPDLRVGLVHGRMRPDDKETAMGAFRTGEVDVLVATTVVEVGVDVADAVVMVIEDAERFGISQLHQLRGRVGRGTERSYCVLFAGWHGELTEEARQRLDAVASTTDGFALAEVDLEIRGEGQLFGERQSGMPDLRLARLARDGALIAETRQAARRLIAADPELEAAGHGALRAEVLRRFGGLAELEALATG